MNNSLLEQSSQVSHRDLRPTLLEQKRIRLQLWKKMNAELGKVDMRFLCLRTVVCTPPGLESRAISKYLEERNVND